MTVTVDWLSTPPLKKHLLQTSSPTSPTPFKFQKRTLDHCPTIKNTKLKRKSLESNVHRYTVLEQNESIVRVMDIDGEEHTLLLKDDWAELNLDNGTQVNVIHTNYVADNPDFLSKSQDFCLADESITETESQGLGGCVSSQRLEDFHISAGKNIIVDNQNGFLVVDPDRLISATTVSDSFACPRKTVLNQKISPSSYNWSLLKGTLLHSLFQARYNLSEELAKQLSKNWDSLYALDLNETQVTEMLVKELGLIKQWYAQNPNIEVVDIEQRLWSFDYGLKGNVDVTVKQGQQLIPLELKTGRQHYSHRAQTSLYSMMMSNYNTQKLGKGILVYLNTVETIEVGTNFAEQRGLILGRNRLVSGRMPPMVENLSTCKNCYVKQECSLYAKAMEADKKYHIDTMNFIDRLTFGMKQTHFDFLRYWEELISVEENSKVSVNKEAIGDLCLESVENLNSSDSKFNYRLKFTGALHGSDRSFLDSNIGDGDPIVLSQGQDRNPIALGYVSNISSDSVWIYTDKNVERLNSRHSIASKFRIATDIYSNNLGVIRGAIYNLFTPNGKFREFIVDLIKPEFSLVESSTINTIREFLNTDQQKAILNALASHSYSLILGMPGTGKTTTM